MLLRLSQKAMKSSKAGGGSRSVCDKKFRASPSPAKSCVLCVVHLVYAHRCGRYILRVYIFLLIPRTFCFAKHLQYKRAEAFFRAPALSLNFLLLLWLKLHEHTLTLGLFLRHPPTTLHLYTHTRGNTHCVHSLARRICPQTLLINRTYGSQVFFDISQLRLFLLCVSFFGAADSPFVEKRAIASIMMGKWSAPFPSHKYWSRKKAQMERNF